MKLPASIGEVDPQLIQQKNPNNCFGAVVEILAGVNQDEVLRALHEAEDSHKLVQPDGRFLQPTAKMLGEALGQLVKVSRVIDPDMSSGFAFDTDSGTSIMRMEHISRALTIGSGVALWAPKRRTGQDPILHAYAVTGYDAAKDQTVVVDPSEIDGEVARLGEAEALGLVTPEPEAFVPVYAYGIQPKES